jgi:hypothetical protein
MGKLWEHVENLAPGIILVVMVCYELHGTLAVTTASLRDVPGAATGALLVALGYTVGAANAALARFVLT